MTDEEVRNVLIENGYTPMPRKYGDIDLNKYGFQTQKRSSIEERIIMKPSREEFIARIRHLGWCCYQIAANQDYNVEQNKDQYESLLQGVKFGLQNLDMTPEQNHENWMKCKTEQGWVYGEVKDFEKKTHPDLVPFDELPKIEADKDIMDAMMNKEANKLYDLFFGEQFYR